MSNAPYTIRSILLGLCFLGFHAIESFSDENRPSLFQVQLGGGYVHTNDPYGISIGASYSRIIDIHKLTLRFIHINDIQPFNTSPDKFANDFSFLYGLCWNPTILKIDRNEKTPFWLSSSLSISGGISAISGVTNGTFISSGFGDNYTADNFTAIGFPFQMDLYLVPHNSFGFGISGFGNVNGKEQYYSIYAGIIFGRLR
jgi:hypothetical protein